MSQKETDEQIAAAEDHEIHEISGETVAKSPLMDRQNYNVSPTRSPPLELMCSSSSDTQETSVYNELQPPQLSNSMPCSPVRHLPDGVDQLAVSSPQTVTTNAVARFPFNIRDTVDWIIGLGMSVSIISSHNTFGQQPTSNNLSLGMIKSNASGRQPSGEIIGDADGCCLVKSLISNLLTFATRSRRKEVNKENRNNANTGVSQPAGSKKTGVVSASQSASTKSRKTPLSENCVAASFDDDMIERLTKIPCGVDRNEWLATHTLDLFDNISFLCGTISDHCTPATCLNMSFPGSTKAYWLDEKGKRHQYAASRYIDCVMSFCEAARKDTIFPTKYGMPFPQDFEQYCRRIIRLLWQCCGHLYTKHWDLMAVLNLRPQYGLVLAHLAAIAKQFVLLDSKELNSLTSTLCLVRPPCLQAPPAKRSGGVGDQFGFSDSSAIANHNIGSVHWSRVSKSGSWGGQSSTTSSITSSMATMPALTNNNMVIGKNALIHSSPYAQTC